MIFFSNIWNIIVKTNTLNFIVFALIIFFICKKIDLPKIISDLQKKIKDDVEKSKAAKNESDNNLQKAKRKIENIEKEIETIISDSTTTAQTMAENIIKKAQTQIDLIEYNAKKVMKNDTDKTKRKLSKYAADASLNMLKNKLSQNLQSNKNLHQSFIDAAIDELEGLEI